MIRYNSNYSDRSKTFDKSTLADNFVNKYDVTSSNGGRKRVCVKYHNSTTSYGLTTDTTASEYSPKLNISNSEYYFGSVTVNGSVVKSNISRTYTITTSYSQTNKTDTIAAMSFFSTSFSTFFDMSEYYYHTLTYRTIGDYNNMYTYSCTIDSNTHSGAGLSLGFYGWSRYFQSTYYSSGYTGYSKTVFSVNTFYELNFQNSGIKTDYVGQNTLIDSRGASANATSHTSYKLSTYVNANINLQSGTTRSSTYKSNYKIYTAYSYSFGYYYGTSSIYVTHTKSHLSTINFSTRTSSYYSNTNNISFIPNIISAILYKTDIIYDEASKFNMQYMYATTAFNIKTQSEEMTISSDIKSTSIHISAYYAPSDTNPWKSTVNINDTTSTTSKTYSKASNQSKYCNNLVNFSLYNSGLSLLRLDSFTYLTSYYENDTVYYSHKTTYSTDNYKFIYKKIDRPILDFSPNAIVSNLPNIYTDNISKRYAYVEYSQYITSENTMLSNGNSVILDMLGVDTISVYTTQFSTTYTYSSYTSKTTSYPYNSYYGSITSSSLTKSLYYNLTIDVTTVNAYCLNPPIMSDSYYISSSFGSLYNSNMPVHNINV